MATINAYPNDFHNLPVGVLAKLSNVDMTAAAVFFVLANTSGQQIILTHVTFAAFSAFGDGVALPSAWAPSWGTNSATTPTSMYNATLGSNVVAPCVIATPTLTAVPYIAPGQSLYFAVVTTTNGVGTIGSVKFCGSYLPK